MRKKMCAMLLAVLLVFTAAVPAMAADASVQTDAAASLSITASYKGNIVTAKVTLSGAEGVTNGRIIAVYDPSVLTLLAADEGSDSWIGSINSETEGQVALAWVASDLAAGENRMLTLQFQVTSRAASTKLTAVAVELYRSGVSVLKEGGAQANTVSCEVNLEDGAVTPVQPLPDPVVKPAQPTPDPDPDTGLVTGPTDIAGHWAEKYILEAYEKGLVNGTSDTTFSPDAMATRGQFVVILWRIAGSPAAKSAAPFTDVKAGSYYEEAVNWAYEMGVLSGTSATTASPDLRITRQEVVTMVYRYAKTVGMDVSAAGSLAGFSDADEVRSWAAEAMAWSIGAGVIQGADGKLMPQKDISRAELATILVRFADN